MRGVVRAFLASDTYSSRLARVLMQQGRVDVILENPDDVQRLRADDKLITCISFRWHEFAASVYQWPGNKTLWVDYSHIQFPEDRDSICQGEWHTVVRCVDESYLPHGIKCAQVVFEPSPVLEEGAKGLQGCQVRPGAAVFISQPLYEDRRLDSQQRLFASIRDRYHFDEWNVLKHPRERVGRWERMQAGILNSVGELREAGFERVFGYNSTLLMEMHIAGYAVQSVRFAGWPTRQMPIPEEIVHDVAV